MVLIILILLLIPRFTSDAHIIDSDSSWTESVVFSSNSPFTPTHRYINEVHKNEDIYMYFMEKSIERKLDIIYNIPFADCIIICESGWNPNAQNPISTAYGLGQFLNSTWNNVNKVLGGNLDRKNPYDQIDAFTYLLSDEGYRHWEVAPSCIHLLPVEKRISSLK